MNHRATPFHVAMRSAFAAALGLLIANSAQASVVELNFSGTYDNVSAQTVFGLSGSGNPYNFQITYDTSLNTNPYVFHTGDQMGNYVAANDWYGYSASGITATNLTVGNQTFTVADLQPMFPVAGVSADLWFNTDISQSAPTLSWMYFFGGSPGVGDLQLGMGTADATHIFMDPRSSIEDYGPDYNYLAQAFSSQVTITETSATPEPATCTLLGTAFLAIGGFHRLRWRRTARVGRLIA